MGIPIQPQQLNNHFRGLHSYSAPQWEFLYNQPHQLNNHFRGLQPLHPNGNSCVRGHPMSAEHDGVFAIDSQTTQHTCQHPRGNLPFALHMPAHLVRRCNDTTLCLDTFKRDLFADWRPNRGSDQFVLIFFLGDQKDCLGSMTLSHFLWFEVTNDDTQASHII